MSNDSDAPRGGGLAKRTLSPRRAHVDHPALKSKNEPVTLDFAFLLDPDGWHSLGCQSLGRLAAASRAFAVALKPATLRRKQSAGHVWWRSERAEAGGISQDIPIERCCFAWTLAFSAEEVAARLWVHLAAQSLIRIWDELRPTREAVQRSWGTAAATLEIIFVPTFASSGKSREALMQMRLRASTASTLDGSDKGVVGLYLLTPDGRSLCFDHLPGRALPGLARCPILSALSREADPLRSFGRERHVAGRECPPPPRLLDGARVLLIAIGSSRSPLPRGAMVGAGAAQDAFHLVIDDRSQLDFALSSVGARTILWRCRDRSSLHRSSHFLQCV